MAYRSAYLSLLCLLAVHAAASAAGPATAPVNAPTVVEDGPFVITTTILTGDLIMENPVAVVSSDLKKVLIGPRTNNKKSPAHIVINGAFGPDFDEVKLLTRQNRDTPAAGVAAGAAASAVPLFPSPYFAFTADGSHYAYIGVRDKKEKIVYDNVESQPVSAINPRDVTLGKTGGFVFLTTQASGVLIFFNGKSYGPYKSISELKMSDDGKHFAALAELLPTPSSPGPKFDLVVDGAVKTTGLLYGLCFSPLGNRAGCIAETEKGSVARVTGTSVTEYPIEPILGRLARAPTPIEFSSDSKHLLMRDRSGVKLDGKKIAAGLFDAAAFSDDGKYLHISSANDSWLLTADGQQSTQIKARLAFSPDFTRYLTVSEVKGAGTQELLTVGLGTDKSAKMLVGKDSLKFLPDGKAITIVPDKTRGISEPERFEIQVEGTPLGRTSLPLLNLAVSPKNRYIASVVSSAPQQSHYCINGVTTTKTVGEIVAPPVFTGPDTLTAIVYHEKFFKRVEVQIAGAIADLPAITAQVFKPELKPHVAPK